MLCYNRLICTGATAVATTALVGATTAAVAAAVIGCALVACCAALRSRLSADACRSSTGFAVIAADVAGITAVPMRDTHVSLLALAMLACNGYLSLVSG